MNCKVIAIANQKGGVAKTTTTQNLAAALRLFHDKRVLIIDGDPQTSLTIAAGVTTELGQVTMFDLLRNGADIADAVIDNVGSGYDLIPGDKRLSLLSKETLKTRGFGELDKLLTRERFKYDYDYVLIDCPPSLTIGSINCLLASDEVIVAARPSYLDVEGADDIRETIEEGLNITTGHIKKWSLLFTMYERTNLSAQIIEDAREVFANIFKTVIRKNVALADAQARGLDVYQYNPLCNGAMDYKNLAAEIVGKVSYSN